MKKNSKPQTDKNQTDKHQTKKADSAQAKTRPLTQLEQQLEQQRIQMQKDDEISAVAGVDIGDKRCFVRLTDLDGESLEECQVPTRPEALDHWFRRWPRLRIVIETGTHSNWIRRRLAALAHDVLVADARQLRLISQSDSKNDRNDAYWLAELGRTNPALLNPVAPRELETEQQRTLLRAREAVLECRTKLKGSLRGMAKSHGIRLGRCAQTQWVERVREACPEVLHAALLGVAMQIESLGATIREYDKQIIELGKRYAAVKRLRTIGGVGPLTALTFVLALDNDPGRVKRSRQVGALVGLRPKQRQSGERSPRLGVTKSGDPLLRRTLIQCAHWVLGPFGTDSTLRRWGLGLAARGGGHQKKRAVVAVARKLAVLMHVLWVKQENYDPLHGLVETVSP